MPAFGFKVPLAAVVRMRAADEMPARKVVRSILAPPAIAKITASRGRFELELEDRALGADRKRISRLPRVAARKSGTRWSIGGGGAADRTVMAAEFSSAGETS